jgi:DNA-binding MarR family transcriptional regulator
MVRPNPARAADARARLRLWYRMLRTARAVESVVRDRLKTAFDTTLPRFDVMAALDRAPDGMMMSELSRFLLVSNGNVTGIVDRLVADGLVARAERDGDRRASIVRITEAGREAFAAMAAAHARWIDELLADISLEDARIATDILFRSQWEHDA